MRFIALLFAVATPFLAMADVPVVEGAAATPGGDGWTIAITVRHADEGWKHYVDGWSIFGEDGAELAHRALAHPHVDEQPFTRSQSGIAIPSNTTRLTARAHDSVHGWGPDFAFTLP